MDLDPLAGFQSVKRTSGRRDRPIPNRADGEGGFQGTPGLPVLGEWDSLTLAVLEINGHGKVYWIKKSSILSEPSTLCEMFTTLGLGVDGTSEEQAIEADNVTPEDFGTLVHFYNEFGSVVL